MANVLFEELIEWASNESKYSLSQVLLRSKVLASQLKSRKFRNWIDCEVNGYKHPAEVPAYRVLDAQLYGDFVGLFESKKNNVYLSVDYLKGELSDIRDALEHVTIRQSISALEDLLKSDPPYFEVNIESRTINFLRENGPMLPIGRYLLNAAVQRVPKASIQGLTNSVRSHLLDFLLDLQKEYPDLSKNGETTKEIPEAIVETAFERNVYQNCVINNGDQMGDFYNANQVGVMGPNAKAENINFIQILRTAIGETSLGELASELGRLRSAMIAESKTEEQDTAVAAVADAEEAAKKGNAQAILGFLKKAGNWALETATKIGSAVAVKAIETAMKPE